ncbi:LEAF RUST 10 DISEASE-RESISTANCE LOCUS RECEPTOR-LIKE PROTEIN KINASE-like 1.2 [Bidens hawaiensis]|uniref:LEAF RUST 10 DISEASE-RESISTANCE LOCUS RECEPTOR-LIKE PROTEIN KINASE-like 1.2 n=1 Tax=Bidens hawaiensis TaxID=980011 RepID=UPI00404B00C9
MKKQPSKNPVFFTFFFLINHSLGLDPKYESCVPKDCGDGQNISYPFYINGKQDQDCGYPGFELQCKNNSPVIQISKIEFTIIHIQYENHRIRLKRPAVSPNCTPVLSSNLTLDPNRFVIVNKTTTTNLLMVSNCVELNSNSIFNSTQFERYRIPSCETTEYVMVEHDANFQTLMDGCGGGGKVVEIPVELDKSVEVDGGNYREVVERGFDMRWLAAECGGCESSGGRCGFNMTVFQFSCFCPDRPHRVSCKPEKPNRKLIVIAVLAGSTFVFALATVIFFIRKRKASAYFSSKDKSRELEDASIYFGASVFSYAELQDATLHFDPSKELGDGGFGTVYYGKLRDGREVAVKRLYDHNYKRVKQFMNEVEILTRLRHKNLVSLYGCTSHKSRELLLVYEYIPNGTVADHLHGKRAKESPLTWHTRMKIAIETASALVYLHASEIIHRDVKTNNILLDNNFCVKVADFGLSRLLPNDATHVSTAPQGTPGYVDPDYHQCYQLTYKSDVYSFGVVLIELISSMPAFDITRSRDEINLANMAINRIQRCALNELIDPSLGSDTKTEKMTTSVAELAFRCLQFDLEMRPTMSEVLEILKGIQVDESDGDIVELTCKKSNLLPPSPENEGVGLLNGRITASPVSVTATWHSTSSGVTTTNTSVCN